MLAWPFKDPDEVADYSIDWTARMEAGDTIASSQWIPIEGDVVIATDSIDGLVTTAWLTGGTIGILYEVTNRITTTGGRTFDQSVKLKIRSK